MAIPKFHMAAMGSHALFNKSLYRDFKVAVGLSGVRMGFLVQLVAFMRAKLGSLVVEAASVSLGFRCFGGIFRGP